MCNEKMLYKKAVLEIIMLIETDVIATSVGLDELEENTPKDTWQ